MSTSGNSIPVEARERLERIVIELAGIAARSEIGPDLSDELMQLAHQVALLLEE